MLPSARICNEENPKMLANSKSEGHRERLRKKLSKSGLKGFHDYEIIEIPYYFSRSTL